MKNALTTRRGLAVVLAAVLAAAALLVPALQLRTGVRLAVDGAVTSVRTTAATVGDVLADEGVEYAAGDRVLPAPATPVEEGDTIRVLRSISVDLDVDGEVVPMRGAFRSVQGVLSAAEVEVADEDIVEPDPRTRLTGGEEIVVRTPKDVTIVTADEETDVTTHVATVGRLLEVQGVEVDGNDRVSSPRGALLEDGLRVRVRDVEVEREVRRRVFDHGTRRVETDDLLKGERRVRRQGRTAVVRVTLETTFVDGEKEGTERVGRQVKRTRRARIVEVGTREPVVRNDGLPAAGSVWHRLAQCESGGRWHIDGYYDGGLQFLPSTWTAYKPAGAPAYAHQATPAQQIDAAQRLQAAAGWGQWPACASKLGLR